MCVGLPVVATPISSYEPLMQQGKKGYSAPTRGDWIACLDALRDPAARDRVGKQARVSVLQRYSMEKQAHPLGTMLRSLVDASADARAGLDTSHVPPRRGVLQRDAGAILRGEILSFKDKAGFSTKCHDSAAAPRVRSVDAARTVNHDQPSRTPIWLTICWSGKA